MADAVVLTARLWDVTWIRGSDDQRIQDTDAVSEDELWRYYETRAGFLDSVNLEDIKNKME